jgi:glucose/arabinose dehydrogenase
MNLRNLALLISLPTLISLQCKKSSGNQEPPGAVELRDSVIASGLQHVWELVWGPDDQIWMTERGGRISRLNLSTGNVTTLLNITEVVSNGEGGLLGMTIHPDFTNNPYVYVVYNYGTSYREKLVRYTYNNNSLGSPLPLLDNIAAASIHNGSRLRIGPDNKLYMTTGDAANQSLPQNINSVNGKVLRLNLDGTIPADNPVAGNPYWSFGHRNAQGLVFAGNKLFVSEHGPNNDDEINIIEKGRNYGWPEVEGYCNSQDENDFCSANNVKEPIMAWTPTVAACGLEFYNNDQIPQWKNSLLMVALKNSRLYQMKLNSAQTEIIQTNEYFKNDFGRLRAICISPGGDVYLGTSNGGNDKIIRVQAK